MIDKPKVRYILDENNRIVVGENAIIKPIDHPFVSNENFVFTSTVLSYDKDNNSFETRNTLYTGEKV